MDAEAFRSRLLPGLEFIADISFIVLETKENIAEYRNRSSDAPAHPFEDKLHIFEEQIPGFQGAMITIRIYQPKRILMAPVIVWCHSGAFISGDLETEHFHCVKSIYDRV